MTGSEAVLEAARTKRTAGKLMIVIEIVGLVAGVVLVAAGAVQECLMVPLTSGPGPQLTCVPPLTPPLMVSGTVIIVLSVGGLLWSVLRRK